MIPAKLSWSALLDLYKDENRAHHLIEQILRPQEQPQKQPQE
jgi:hypothetical protein